MVKQFKALEVDQALKASAANYQRCFNNPGLLTTPAVCMKAVLEHIVEPYHISCTVLYWRK